MNIEKAIDEFNYQLVIKKKKEFDKQKIPNNLVFEFLLLSREVEVLKLGLETLRRIIIKNKLATKKEIDDMIDDLFIKKIKRGTYN